MKTLSVKFFTCIAFALMLSSQMAFAQHPPIKKFVPNDTIWKRTVRRILDLDRPSNSLIKSEDNLIEKKSLIGIIMKGIKDSVLTPYDPLTGGLNTGGVLSYDDLYVKLGGGSETYPIDILDDSGQVIGQKDTVTQNNIDYREVCRFLLEEEYIFIKTNSIFKRQVLRLCPIRVFEEEGKDGLQYQQIAWFDYDELKPLLDEEKLVKASNLNSELPFLSPNGDFESFIVSINNSYGTDIAKYTSNYGIEVRPTLEMMLESRRIEYELMNFEMNLWEY